MSGPDETALPKIDWREIRRAAGAMGWSPRVLRNASLIEFRDFFDGWAMARGLKKAGLDARTLHDLKDMLDAQRTL